MRRISARTFAELWRAAGSSGLGDIQALCLSAAVVREIDTLGWADRKSVV